MLHLMECIVVFNLTLHIALFPGNGVISNILHGPDIYEDEGMEKVGIGKEKCLFFFFTSFSVFDLVLSPLLLLNLMRVGTEEHLVSWS